MPCPDAPDWDPSCRTITRLICAAMIASAQGGVRPCAQHGLQRHVKRGAPRIISSRLRAVLQRLDFRVRLARRNDAQPWPRSLSRA